MAAFLLVFDNLIPALTADYRKNHLTFQIFHYSCFSTAATKCSCYQDSSVIQSWFVYLVFRLRKATPRDSTKVNVEKAGSYSRVQGRFLTSLARFEELHPRPSERE